MEQSNYYTYRVTWSKDDEQFVGLCAEFPSLSWLDETQEKALVGIKSVVDVVILDMLQTDEVPSKPLSLINFPGKCSLRMDPELHRELAIQAAESGISLNRYLNAKLSRK
ncbi:MAG: toxin-antitoxin system HicB family antitoxin [Planctomycetes bacterium]|nr:toxin-antitoxin system HicB family antitoxin [Planctomycetota bacterium]